MEKDDFLATSDASSLIDLNAIFVISLDLSSALARNLGIQSFLSESLREIARSLIREAFLSEAEYPDPDRLSRQFEAAVLEEAPNGTIEMIRTWQRSAFPDHARATGFWVWKLLLKSLELQWEEDGLIESLPLSRPELAWARISIRDYNDALDNIRDEVSATAKALKSSWDTGIEEHCEDWFAGESVLSDIMDVSPTCKLWAKLRSGLDPLDLDALKEWGMKEALSRDLPPEYAEIPSLEDGQMPPWGRSK